MRHTCGYSRPSEAARRAGFHSVKARQPDLLKADEQGGAPRDHIVIGLVSERVT